MKREQKIEVLGITSIVSAACASACHLWLYRQSGKHLNLVLLCVMCFLTGLSTSNYFNFRSTNRRFRALRKEIGMPPEAVGE